jgi:asparagine synthase (glutamine-hydrolysing)
MCGIAGVYNDSFTVEAYPRRIKEMLSLIHHRGPDEVGYYIDDHIAFGTTRLSIIDMLAGNQPLSDRAQRYWICYNGELYNYKELREELQEKCRCFATLSDTEVILQSWMHWGDECFDRFNGAFAFAIYDRLEDTLVLARDRFGKRPLYYFAQSGTLVFASEMKAFLGYEPFTFAIDPHALTSILGVWTPLPYQSGFRHIQQLPMGEYLLVRGEQITRKRYASLSFDTPPFGKSEADAIECIRTALSESVRLRLRSDVEVGVYLSGGLDSSIVTALTTQISSYPVQTFSVEFEDKSYDESIDQRVLAEALGTKHSALTISETDIVEHFPQAIYHAEVPAFRTAFVPMFLLSKSVHAAGIKVVLSGEGADEVFLGYDLFKDTLLQSTWNTINNEERRAKLAQMYPYLEHFNSARQNHLLGLYQQFSVERMPGLLSHEMRFQNGRFSARLLQTQFDPFEEILAYTQADEHFATLSPVQKAQWLEFKTLLAGYLLSTQGERMSLAHAVENRCPFLDPHVVALASAVNLQFDDGFNEKYLLRKAFQDCLPNSIVTKHKFPYRAPDSASFVKHHPDYLEALLSESELKSTDILDTKFAQALTKKIFSTPPERVSTKENQTFIFLLSIALLHNYFVKRNAPRENTRSSIDKILVKAIDMRERIQ